MWKLHIFMPTKSDTVEPVSSGWSLKSENPPPPQIIVAVTVTSIKQSLSTLNPNGLFVQSLPVLNGHLKCNHSN